MVSLIEQKRGVYSTIQSISKKAPFKIRRRLYELGFTKGEKVRVVRLSMLAYAYLIEVRGYTLTLRKDIARYILVA